LAGNRLWQIQKFLLTSSIFSMHHRGESKILRRYFGSSG
jgi:hypothetical protein